MLFVIVRPDAELATRVSRGDVRSGGVEFGAGYGGGVTAVEEAVGGGGGGGAGAVCAWLEC